MQDYIKVENLTYIYNYKLPNECYAINNINFSLTKGKTLGIIGHTGSGKSTLIKHLNAILKPTSGKVYIDGEDIFENKENLKNIRFKVGLVFQYPEYQLFEETVYKDIAFGPSNMKLDEEEIKNRVIAAAKLLSIDNSLLFRSPFELSGGQKRKVAIAGILAMKPEILVLDEPSASLDPMSKDLIFSQIENYKRKYNATVIFVSHSMEDIAAYCDEVLVLNKGEVFCHDKVSDVFKKANELRKIGLDIPVITSIMLKLNKKFNKLNYNIFNTSDAKNEILRYLKEEKNA